MSSINTETKPNSFIPYIKEISERKKIGDVAPLFHREISPYFNNPNLLGLIFIAPDETRINSITQRVLDLTDEEKEEAHGLYELINPETSELRDPEGKTRTRRSERSNQRRKVANELADKIIDGEYVDENGEIQQVTDEEQDKLIAQLIYAIEQEQARREKIELDSLLRYQENQALTKEQTDRLTEILNKSFDKQIQKAQELERKGDFKNPLSPDKAERIRRVIIPWLIHPQNSPRLKAFAKIAILGLEDSFEHPLDSIPTAMDSISLLAEAWHSELEIENLERLTSQAPEGHDLEVALHSMDIPISIFIRNEDGSIRELQTEIGPSTTIDLLRGDKGRVERIGYSSPMIEGGRVLPKSWFEEQEDQVGRKIYDIRYLDSIEITESFNGIFRISDSYNFPITKEFYNSLSEEKKHLIGDFNNLPVYDIGQDQTDRRIFVNPSIAGGNPLPFVFLKQTVLSSDNQDLILATRLNQQKFFIHPSIQHPFTQEWYTSLPQNQKIKNERGIVLEFSDLIKTLDLHVLLDEDPTIGNNPMAYGDILWTSDMEEKKAFSRGAWTSYIAHKIEQEYNLPEKWIENIIAITGESVRNNPFIVGENFSTGKKVWEEAMIYYYGAFLKQAEDILSATAYLRRFDPAYSRDNIPDPMKKSLQYLRYLSYYGMCPPETREMAESLTGDVFEAYAKLFPEYEAIENRTRGNFHLRYMRPILYTGDTITITQELKQRITYLTQESQTRELTNEENQELEDYRENIPLLIPFKGIQRDDNGNVILDSNGNPSYRELTPKEKKVLLNMMFLPRLTPFQQSGIARNLERLNGRDNPISEEIKQIKEFTDQPAYWEYFNSITYFYEKALSLLRNESDPQKREEIIEEYKAKARKKYIAHKKLVTNENQQHLNFNQNASRQEVWARYQNLTPEEREIIKDIDFGSTAISMGFDYKYSNIEERLGWRALSDFIEISMNIDHFNPGTEPKSIKKRAIKYLIAEATRVKSMVNAIQNTIQGLDAFFYQEIGVSFGTGDLSEQSAVKIGEILAESFFGRLSKVIADYSKQLYESEPNAFNAPQIGQDGQRLIAIESIYLLYSLLGHYVGPMHVGKDGTQEKSNQVIINETGRTLSLTNPKDKNENELDLYGFTRGLIISGGGSVHSVFGKNSVVSDQNNDAVMMFVVSNEEHSEGNTRIDSRNILRPFGHGLSIEDTLKILRNYATTICDRGTFSAQDRNAILSNLDALAKFSQIIV